MNGLKRQAPFKRQLLQIRLLTVLNYSSVQWPAVIKPVSFQGPLSYKRIETKI
jgi:hypothetical protein